MATNYGIDPTTDAFTSGGTSAHGVVLNFERGKTRKLKHVIEANMAEMFPPGDPGHKAVGTKILVQLKMVAEKTAGGVIRSIESREADQLSTPYGKVVSMGSACFQQAATKFEADFKVGDYVRVPKWTGDRFQVDGVIFTFYNWWDVIAVIEPELLAN